MSEVSNRLNDAKQSKTLNNNNNGIMEHNQDKTADIIFVYLDL